MYSFLPIVISVFISAAVIIAVLLWKIKPPADGAAPLSARLAEETKALQALREKLEAKEKEFSQAVAEAAGQRAACHAALENANVSSARLRDLENAYAQLVDAQKVDIARAATAEQKVEGIHAHNLNLARTIEALTEERTALQMSLAEALAKQQADNAAAQSFENIGQKILKDTLQEATKNMEALAGVYQKTSGLELEKHSAKLTLTLEPLQNKLKEYDAAVDALKLNTTEIFGGIKTQMAELQTAERALHDQARALTNALSAAPKIRGTYGEIILKQLVEFVGMQDRCHFETQASRETEDGRKIPDLVISLPGGQKVIVDSKAVMSACTEAFQATDEQERKLCLKRHCDNVRARVIDLSAKNYFADHADAVEAVVLFLPAENLYAVAMENDPDLTEFAMRRNIILCGPNSLIMLLKVANQVWRRASIEAEAQQIAKIGGEIYKASTAFLEKYASVGARIKSLEKEYNSALGTLDGTLIPKARSMNQFKSVDSSRLLEDILPLKEDLGDYRSPEGKKMIHGLNQQALTLSSGEEFPT